MKLSTFLAAPVVLSSALIGLNAANAADVSSGLYSGIGVGNTIAHDVQSSAGLDDNNDTNLNAFVGYKFNNWFSTELGFNDFGDLRFNNADGSTSELGSKAYSLSAIGEIPVWAGLIGYGRVGGAYIDSDISSSDVGVDVNSEWAPVYGLGVKYQWETVPLFTRLEYTRYDIDSDFKLDTTQLSIGAQF
ncbi:outer membrane beta-barrel protein [Halotalea alkalilenta]|uniref:Outer membrane protein OmpA-like transmembrane domain-containing protein n=1 Tax=Halotalea alkalilenta TaxID=376489 RepID=A0A172YEL3_9GAMM|nr:outer membrane beta-barrel protein [Halotalea alkalilenta]ANF57698.1 hypothetical protein A5892_09665 [Halotalea alkalilenta]